MLYTVVLTNSLAVVSGGASADVIPAAAFIHFAVAANEETVADVVPAWSKTTVNISPISHSTQLHATR